MKERTKSKSKTLKLFRSGKAKTISIISLIVLAFTSLTIYVAANQSIKVSVTEAPDVDLVLTKGKTKIDLANFETDLKAELSKQNINPDKVKVQAISAQTVETQNSFTWQRDISPSIGSISLNETGNNVNMYGNPYNAGTNVMWIEPKDNEEQEFSMNYSINFGDSFNAAGMLLRVENDNGILKGYVLSFNNISWRNSSGGNNGAIWEFQYVVGQHYFSKLQLVKGININTSGTLNVKATDTKVEINGGGITDTLTVNLPTIYGSGYGFFSDHYSHGCSNIGQFSLTNIKLDKTSIKDFNSVLQEPKWNDNTIRTIVHVQDSTRDEFAENAQVSDMLERMMNKGIYYIGWGTDANKTQMESTLAENDGQGMYTENTKYQTAISETAKYIKSLMKSYKDTKTIIADEPYDLNISPSNIQSNTSDSDYPNGKWLVKQDTSKITNPDGQYEKSGQYQDTLTNDFKYPGEYTIFYEDQEVERINVHRRPISSIKFTISQGQYNLDGTESYDLDHDDQANKGIKSYKWEYKKVSVGESNDWVNISDQGTATWKAPTTDNYLIRLVVTDADGAESIPTIKHVTGVSSDDSTLKPIADFTIKDAKFYYGNKLEVVDNSYDPAGLEIKSRTWKIVKDGSIDVYEGENPVLDYNPETNKTIDSNKIGVGKYSISLKATNSKGTTSDEFIGNFEVTDDVTAPTVTATPDNDEKTNEAIDVKLKFTDTESGVLGYKYQITNSQEKIDKNDKNFIEGEIDTNNESTIKVNNTEENQYIHVIAYDNKGNTSEDRVIGKFFIHSKYTIKIQALNNNLGIQGITFNVEGQYQNGDSINLGNFIAQTDNNGIITIPDVPLKKGQNGITITPLIMPEGVSLANNAKYKYAMILLDDDLKMQKDLTSTSDGVAVSVTNEPVQDRNAFIKIPFNQEKAGLVIYNVDSAYPDNYISDAIFELRDNTTRNVIDSEICTNGSTKLSFDMPTGRENITYLLSQTKASAGYDTLNGDITLTIAYSNGKILNITSSDSSILVKNSPWNITIPNSRSASVNYKNNIKLKMQAIDSITNEAIPGVKYSVDVTQTDTTNGQTALHYEINDLETDQDGYLTFNNLYAIENEAYSATIKVEREEVPSAYIKQRSSNSFNFVVDSTGAMIDANNTQIQNDTIELDADKIVKKATRNVCRFRVVDNENQDIGLEGLKYFVENYDETDAIDTNNGNLPKSVATDSKGRIEIKPFALDGYGEAIYRISPDGEEQYGLELGKILFSVTLDKAGAMSEARQVSSLGNVDVNLKEETTDVSVDVVAEVTYKVNIPGIQGKNYLRINLSNSEDRNPIKGSVYQVLFTTNTGYQCSALITTDDNGVALTKIPEADYLKMEIKELKATSGFRRDVITKTIEVKEADGSLVKVSDTNMDSPYYWDISENNDINVVLSNEPNKIVSAVLRVHLSDKNGNQLLKNAIFTVTNVATDESSTQLTTDSNGEAIYNGLRFNGVGCFNVKINEIQSAPNYAVPGLNEQYKIQFRIVKENGVLKYKDYTVLSGTNGQLAEPTISYDEEENNITADIYLFNTIDGGVFDNTHYSIDIDRVDSNANPISTDMIGKDNAQYKVNFVPSNTSTSRLITPLTIKTDLSNSTDEEVEISHIEKTKGNLMLMLQQTTAEQGRKVDNSPILIPIKYDETTGAIGINNDSSVVSSIQDPVYNHYLTSTSGGVYAMVDYSPAIQGTTEQVLHIVIKMDDKKDNSLPKDTKFDVDFIKLAQNTEYNPDTTDNILTGAKYDVQVSNAGEDYSNKKSITINGMDNENSELQKLDLSESTMIKLNQTVNENGVTVNGATHTLQIKYDKNTKAFSLGDQTTFEGAYIYAVIGKTTSTTNEPSRNVLHIIMIDTPATVTIRLFNKQRGNSNWTNGNTGINEDYYAELGSTTAGSRKGHQLSVEEQYALPFREDTLIDSSGYRFMKQNDGSQNKTICRTYLVDENGNVSNDVYEEVTSETNAIQNDNYGTDSIRLQKNYKNKTAKIELYEEHVIYDYRKSDKTQEFTLQFDEDENVKKSINSGNLNVSEVVVPGVNTVYSGDSNIKYSYNYNDQYYYYRYVTKAKQIADKYEYKFWEYSGLDTCWIPQYYYLDNQGKRKYVSLSQRDDSWNNVHNSTNDEYQDKTIGKDEWHVYNGINSATLTQYNEGLSYWANFYYDIHKDYKEWHDGRHGFDGINYSLQQTDKTTSSGKYYASDYLYNKDKTLRTTKQVIDAIRDDAKSSYNYIASNNSTANVDWHPYYCVDVWQEKKVDLSTDEYNCIGKNIINVGWLHEKSDYPTNLEFNVNDADTKEAIQNTQFVVQVKDTNKFEPVTTKIYDNRNYSDMVTTNADGKSKLIMDHNFVSRTVEYTALISEAGYVADSDCDGGQRKYTSDGISTFTFQITYDDDGYIIPDKIKVIQGGTNDNIVTSVDEMLQKNLKIAIIKTATNSLSIYVREQAKSNFEIKVNKKSNIQNADESYSGIKGVRFEALVQDVIDTTNTSAESSNTSSTSGSSSSSTQSVVNYHTNSSAETDENGNVTIRVNLKGTVAAYNNKKIKLLLTETQTVNGYDSQQQTEILVPFINGKPDNDTISCNSPYFISANGTSANGKVGVQINLIDKKIDTPNFILHTIDADTTDEINAPMNLVGAKYSVKVYEGGTRYHEDPVNNRTLLPDSTVAPIEASDEAGITKFTMNTSHSYAGKYSENYDVNGHIMSLGNGQYKNTVVYEITQTDATNKYNVNNPMLVEVLYDRDGNIYNIQVLSNQTFGTPYGVKPAIDISAGYEYADKNKKTIELTIRNELEPEFRLDLTKVDIKNNENPMQGAFFNVQSYVRKDDNTYDFNTVDESIYTTSTNDAGFITAGFRKDNSGKTVLYKVTEVKSQINATTGQTSYFDDVLRGFVEVSFNNYGEINSYRFVKNIGGTISQLSQGEYNIGDNYLSEYNQQEYVEGLNEKRLGVKVNASTFKIGMFLYAPNNTVYSKQGATYKINVQLYKTDSTTQEPYSCNFITDASNENGIIENTIGTNKDAIIENTLGTNKDASDSNVMGEVLRNRKETLTITPYTELKDYLPTDPITITLTFDQNGNYILNPSTNVSGLFEYASARLTTSKINTMEKNNLELDIPLYERDRQQLSIKLSDDIDQSLITDVQNAYVLNSDSTPNGVISNEAISIDRDGNAIFDLGPNYRWENQTVIYTLVQKETDDNHVINYSGTNENAQISVNYDNKGKISNVTVSPSAGTKPTGGLDGNQITADLSNSKGTNLILLNDVNRRKTTATIKNISSTSNDNIQGSMFQIKTVDTGVSTQTSKTDTQYVPYEYNRAGTNENNSTTTPGKTTSISTKGTQTTITADGKTFIEPTITTTSQITGNQRNSVTVTKNMLNYMDGLDNDITKETDSNGELTLNPGPHFTGKTVRYVLNQKTKANTTQMTQLEFEAYEGYKQLPSQGIEFEITWDSNGNFVSGNIANCPDTSNTALVAEYDKYTSDNLITFTAGSNPYDFNITIKSIPKLTVGIVTKNSVTGENIGNGKYHLALYSDNGKQIGTSDVLKTYDNFITHGGINTQIINKYTSTQKVYLLVYEDQAPTGYQYIYQSTAGLSKNDITSGLVAIYSYTIDSNENMISPLQQVKVPITSLNITQDVINKTMAYSSRFTVDTSNIGNNHKETAHDIHLNISYDKTKEFLVHLKNVRGDTQAGLENVKFKLTYVNGQLGNTIEGDNVKTDSQGIISVPDADSTITNDCFNLGMLNTDSTLQLKIHQDYSGVQAIDQALGEINDVGLSIKLNKDGGIDVDAKGNIQNISVLNDGATYLIINGNACKISRGASEYELNITVINSPKLTFNIKNITSGNSPTSLDSDINILENGINISTDTLTNKIFNVPTSGANKEIVPQPNSEVKYEIDQIKINTPGNFVLSNPIEFKIKYDNDGSITNISSDKFTFKTTTNNGEITGYTSDTSECNIQWIIKNKYTIYINIINKENFSLTVNLLDYYDKPISLANNNSKYTIDVKEILTTEGVNSGRTYDGYRNFDYSLPVSKISGEPEDLSYTFNNTNLNNGGITADSGKSARTNITPTSQTIKNYSYYYIKINEDNLNRATNGEYTKKLSDDVGNGFRYASGNDYDAKVRVYFDKNDNPQVDQVYLRTDSGRYSDIRNFGDYLNVSAQANSKNIVITIKVAPKITLNIVREDGITGQKLINRNINVTRIKTTSENRSAISQGYSCDLEQIGTFTTDINGIATGNIKGGLTINRGNPNYWTSNSNVPTNCDEIFVLSDTSSNDDISRTKILNKKLYVNIDSNGYIAGASTDLVDKDIVNVSYNQQSRTINVVLKDIRMVNFIIRNMDYINKQDRSRMSTLYQKTGISEQFEFKNGITNNSYTVSTSEKSGNLPKVAVGTTVSNGRITYSVIQNTNNKIGYEQIPSMNFEVKFDTNGNIVTKKDSDGRIIPDVNLFNNSDATQRLRFEIEDPTDPTTMTIYIYSQPQLLVKLHAVDKYSNSENANGINGLKFMVQRLDGNGNVDQNQVYSNGIYSNDSLTREYKSENGNVFIPVKYVDVIENNAFANTTLKYRISSDPSYTNVGDTEDYGEIDPIDFEITFQGTTGDIITNNSLATYPTAIPGTTGHISKNYDGMGVYNENSLNHSSSISSVHAVDLGTEKGFRELDVRIKMSKKIGIGFIVTNDKQNTAKLDDVKFNVQEEIEGNSTQSASKDTDPTDTNGETYVYMANSNDFNDYTGQIRHVTYKISQISSGSNIGYRFIEDIKFKLVIDQNGKILSSKPEYKSGKTSNITIELSNTKEYLKLPKSSKNVNIIVKIKLTQGVTFRVINRDIDDTDSNPIPINGSKFNIKVSNTNSVDGEKTYTTNDNGIIKNENGDLGIRNLDNNDGDIIIDIDQISIPNGFADSDKNHKSQIKFALTTGTKEISISNPSNEWTQKVTADGGEYYIPDNNGNERYYIKYNNKTGIIEAYYYNKSQLTLDILSKDYSKAQEDQTLALLGAQYSISYQEGVANTDLQTIALNPVNTIEDNVKEDNSDGTVDGHTKFNILGTHQFSNKTVLFTLKNESAPYIINKNDSNKKLEYLPLTDVVSFYVTFNDKGQIVDSNGNLSGGKNAPSDIINIYEHNGNAPQNISRVDAKSVDNCNAINLELMFVENIAELNPNYKLRIYNLDDKNPLGTVKGSDTNDDNHPEYTVIFAQKDSNGNYNTIAQKTGTVDDSGVLTVKNLAYTGDLQVTIIQNTIGENHYGVPSPNNIGIIRYSANVTSNNDINLQMDSQFNNVDKGTSAEKYVKVENGNKYTDNEYMTGIVDSKLNLINVKVYNVQVISVKLCEVASDGTTPVHYTNDAEKLEYTFTTGNDTATTKTNENGEISFNIIKPANVTTETIVINQTNHKGILDNDGNVTIEYDATNGKVTSVTSSDSKIFIVKHNDYDVTINSVQRDNLNETYNIKLNLYKIDSSNSIFLPNATLQVLIKRSGVTFYKVVTTDENGMASVDFPIVRSADYEITEQLSPDGYINDNITKYKFRIDVDNFGNVTIDPTSIQNISEPNITSGMTSGGEGIVELKIPNAANGSKIIVHNIQRTSQGNTPAINISGSTFEIIDVANNKKYTCKSDKNGLAKIVLTQITDDTKDYQYKIKQVQAANGYELDSSDRIINVRYNSDGTINKVSINNGYDQPTIDANNTATTIKFENELSKSNYPKFYIEVLDTDDTARSLPIQGTQYKIEFNDISSTGETGVDGKFKTAQMSHKGDFTIKLTETAINNSYTRQIAPYIITGNITAQGAVTINDKGGTDCTYDDNTRTFKVHLTNKLLNNQLVIQVNKCYIDDNNQIQRIRSNPVKFNVKIGDEEPKTITTDMENGQYVFAPVSTANISTLPISITEETKPTGYEKLKDTLTATVTFVANTTGGYVVNGVTSDSNTYLKVGQVSDTFVELDVINKKSSNADISPSDEELYLRSKDDIYPVTSDLKYMYKIQPWTTVQEFMNKIDTNGTAKVYDTNGNEKANNDLVGTGMKVTSTKEGKAISYTIIVRGDCDGDGEIHAKDRNDIQNLILGISVRSKLPLEQVEKAADVDYNGGIHVKDRNMVQYVILNNNKFQDHESTNN